MMQQLDVGLPVFDKGHTVGVMIDRDIAIRAVAGGKGPEETSVGETMTSNLVVCYEEQRLEEAARLLADQ